MLAMSVRSNDVVLRKILALESLEKTYVEKRLSQIVRYHALQLLAYAKTLVPISTGALRRSLQMDVFAFGLAAMVGSWLRYAARQEFDASLNQSVRAAKRRKVNTIAGRKGSIIKGTAQTNPNATWGFLRKSLRHQTAPFLADIKMLRDEFARFFEDA